jgi:2-C-methyl-D-erythritol 2,4-cyclodiphosphate synthase
VKITTPEDLQRARRGEPSAAAARIGTGYDLHRLVEGRPLIIGGVTVPADKGAVGHSDADVVCHAVIDAVLGAACAGNVGQHYPDTDARWKGASSILLLRDACRHVADRGYAVANVDVTVLLERPRIAPFIAEIRACLAGALGIDPDAVSVKGKTNEGVDAVGRGEAIAAHAVALLRTT